MKGIYAYVDTMDNSVVYVGKDSHIGENRRHRQHYQESNYNMQPINRVLQNNPNRYEYKEIFVFDEISSKELNQLEMQQIALFNPKFNFTKGGDGLKGYKPKPFTEEHRRKISENNARYWKGISLSEEHRRKMSEAHKGKTLSKEHREKISAKMNSTGYYRVYKVKNKKLKQGFSWGYQYYDAEKKRCIYSVNFDKLEEKVKAKGLEWYKFEEVLE